VKISKKNKIIEIINNSETELTPREIAEKTGFNHSTVRKYLRELLERGKIIQPYHGTYASAITHGMGSSSSPFRAHNLILTVEHASWLSFSDDITQQYGDVKFRVQFGLKRHKITLRLSCDSGMDKNTFCFALKRFHDLVKERTGHELETDKVFFKTFEEHRDQQGVRIDPVKGCYTWTDLFGVIDRIYQKREDVVRTEKKISGPMSLEDFIKSFSAGPYGTGNIQQGLYILGKKVDALVDAQKYQNLKITEGSQRLDALEKATTETPSWIKPVLSSISDVQNQLDVLNKGQMVTDQKISRLLDANIIMTANVNKLVEAITKLTTKPKRKAKKKPQPKPKPLWKKVLHIK